MNLEILPMKGVVEDVKFQMDFHSDEGNRAPIVLKDDDELYFVNYLYGMYEEPKLQETYINTC